MRLALKILFLFFILVAGVSGAENIGPLELRSQATSGTEGILLTDLVTNKTDQALPKLILGPAPQIGRPVFFSRAQVNDLFTKKAPELACSNWTGADRIRITRATRILNQAMLSELLTSALQSEQVKDRGDLELRFTRPWSNLVVPDEPLSLKILEIPSSGVSPNFICRFELTAGGEAFGVFQQSLQAKVWKEVYVAHTHLQRGQLLREADLTLEKRDLLTNRDFLTNIPLDDPFIEFRENVPAGTLLTSRVLRLRAVVKRGRQVDAMFQDASLTISVRAEALEDGVPGQVVRLRNVQSRREFKGKVQDEQTVLVMF
ncbi:MAG TPA: flagellar basal body P-ring formation chaperone FlgA [Verrucomicrobiae bacterium]|nr:flagellar basal body P-ring formation chaperone FlgA [Verrucomicrobiae bacterium]